MKRMNVKKLLGAGIKIVIAVVVLIFLGMKSLDFFYFTTPQEEYYYAWLGFGLTGGGLIAYLLIFMWDADTELKKTVAIVMLAVCLLGELATAGFGLQIDAWQKGGYELVQEDFDMMVRAVQLLGFAHALALLAYVAGDKLAEAFGDHDGDGIPNFADKDYRGQGRHGNGSNSHFAPKQVQSFAKDAKQAKLAESEENPTQPGPN